VALLLGGFVEAANLGLMGNMLVIESPKGREYVVMVVGESEALSIGVALYGRKFWRPLSHDLMAHIVRLSGLEPLKVEIYDVKDGAYLARIYLQKRSFLWFRQKVVLDSRPSDAIAFALRVGIPIYVAEHLFKSPEELLQPDTLEQIPGGIEG